MKQTANVPMTMKQMMIQMPMRHTSRMSLSDDDVTEWWFVVCSCVTSTTETSTCTWHYQRANVYENT